MPLVQGGSAENAVVDCPQDHNGRDPAEACDTGLYLIGVFKLVKALFFIAVSLGALHFVHHDLMSSADRFVQFLRVDPESHLVNFAMDKLGLVTHHRLRLISMGSSSYAMLCLLEAYGLLRRRVWAEFLTLWISVSFLPWEAWEIVHRPTAWHGVIIGTNLLVVAYLLWMLKRNNRKHRDLWMHLQSQRRSAPAR